MRKRLPVAFGIILGFALGWVLHAAPARTNHPSPDQIGVRTISIHTPDGHGGTTYHVLKVFRVSFDGGILDCGEPRPGNWIVATSQSETGGGWGQVTYYASPTD